MPEKDPVLIDEARHDREQTAQEMLEEMGMEQALEEFASGDLDDEMRDAVADDPTDAFEIARFWICLDDEIKADIQTRIAACELHPGLFYEPRINVQSFGTTIDGIINRRAREITENK
jgi:hypothetical protein